MKLKSLFCLLILVASLKGQSESPMKGGGEVSRENKISVLAKSIDSLVLHLALKGYSSIQDSNAAKGTFLAIVDFSKSSTEKRFFLISMNDTTLVHMDYVSHGKYSGELYAHSFSNEKRSLKSSLGFYKVSESYYGNHGLSIRLDGLDPGFNDNARERAVVMHAADYAEPIVIKELGRLGRSFGCPALPFSGFSLVAGQIKENAILFHYYPDEEYLKKCIWLHE